MAANGAEGAVFGGHTHRQTIKYDFNLIAVFKGIDCVFGHIRTKAATFVPRNEALPKSYSQDIHKMPRDNYLDRSQPLSLTGAGRKTRDTKAARFTSPDW